MDKEPIRRILLAAFPTPEEADLVDHLRGDAAVLLSLVADAGQGPVGHVLFTRMYIGDAPAVALAPLAVLPEHQRTGIGGKLIRAGIEELRRLGERVVTVLGAPAYYTRFGFSAPLAAGLSHPFQAEHYMALVLDPGAMPEGQVRYASAFGIGPA